MALNIEADVRLNAPRILITGATGRIGRHLLEDLKKSNFQIRATTSKHLSDEQRSDPRVEWRQHDFMTSLAIDSLMEGCDAVLHLAAELWDISRMPRVNVEATHALAEAAKRQGVRFFGFTSSVAVYGRSKTANVDEATPLLTADRDVKSEHCGDPHMRAYGRSKVLGERAIAAVASTMECVVFRPTVVIDLPDILAIARRGPAMRFLLGRRHEHLIYVKDVAHALGWFVDRALSRNDPSPGLEIFNLSDDASDVATGEAISSRAFAACGASEFRPTPSAPLWLYGWVSLAKNKCISRRLPLGRMFFSARKLFATGYVFQYGMAEAHRQAFAAYPFSANTTPAK